MSEQQLPNYTEAFKDVPWETRESAHYKFHYTKSSLAENEIEKIVQTQEAAYKKITQFLALPSYPEKKICYYLYPDAETKERLMGSPWFAQSIYNDFAVHALYTEEHRVIGPHEDTHLLSLPLGLSIGFLQEGLAEYMVGHDWFGNSFETSVQEGLKQKDFVISDSLPIKHRDWIDTDDRYARQYYSLAALFTKSLLDQYGKEKCLKLYSNLKRDNSPPENEKCYVEILGTSSKELFAACLNGVS
jgi:hypothetical protein